MSGLEIYFNNELIAHFENLPFPVAEYVRSKPDRIQHPDVKWVFKETCHCGKSIHVEPDGFTRDLCLRCSLERCDIPVADTVYSCGRMAPGEALYEDEES